MPRRSPDERLTQSSVLGQQTHSISDLDSDLVSIDANC